MLRFVIKSYRRIVDARCDVLEKRRDARMAHLCDRTLDVAAD